MIPVRAELLAVAPRGTALAMLLLTACAAGCRDVAVVTASYATLAEAQAAGAIERGWIPGVVPPGAHDIREAHDPDTNRRWGLFSFTGADVAPLEAVLQPEETTLAGVECDIPARIEWWPVLLRNTLSADSIKAAGLKAYKARQGSLIVVVNWNQGRAYYWSV
jgi:hypothetical protein